MNNRCFLFGYFFYVCCLLYCCFSPIEAQKLHAQSIEKKVPSTLWHRLDSLRQADNLEEWLYSCMDYVQINPPERIDWLAVVQQQVWRTGRNPAERLAWLYFLAMQGYYQLYNGNILHSINAYEQAYRFYFDQPLPQANVVEYVLKPLGNNYTRLGDYDKALFIQEKSLQLAQQNDSQQIAGVYNNLAITARWKGEWQQAKLFAEKGLERVQKNSPLHGLLLSTRADILYQLHLLPQAEENIGTALRILQAPTNENKDNVAYWLLSAYLIKGNILQEKKELQPALTVYQKADKIVQETFKRQRKREQAKIWVAMGDVWLKLNQPQQANRLYHDAIALLVGTEKKYTVTPPDASKLYGENTLLDAIKGAAEALLFQNKKEEALTYLLLLFEVEKKLRHEFFSREAKEQQQKEDRAWMETAMNTAFDLWQSSGAKKYAQNLLLIAERSKAQLLLDNMMQNLYYQRIQSGDTLLRKQYQAVQAVSWYEKEEILQEEAHMHNAKLSNAKKEVEYQLSLIQKAIKEKYGEQAPFIMQEEQPHAAALLSSIPSGTLVAEYFMGEKNAYLILAKNAEVLTVHKWADADGMKQQINSFAATYFQNGVDELVQRPQHYYKDAYTLYNKFARGILSYHPNHCLLIPDGAIGNLPFDALLTDSVFRQNVDQWPFMLKQVNLFYSYSLLTWQQQQQMKHPHTLVAGFFISFDSSEQASLPAVKKEYRNLQQQLKGKFYLEQKATITAFQQTLPQVNLLHISTHSFVRGREHTPVLQLANDPFYLFQLYGQSFQPQLVVLSACRTAQGMLSEGEGIISLARGFTAAGSGGIIASQWNMNDESTAELMANFYQQLKKSTSPADALHTAKLQWLAQKHENTIYKLPYFWAGLIYMGDDRALNLPHSSSWPALPIWISGTLLIILLTIVFLKLKKKKNVR